MDRGGGGAILTNEEFSVPPYGVRYRGGPLLGWAGTGVVS